MILITSGAYVINEFQAELGKIPPCFLPLGNKKLLEHQVLTLSQHFPDEQIILSLPESYQLSSAEKKLIISLNVLAVAVPDDFSLAESISYMINVTNYLPKEDSIKIMYGDTLIHDLPENLEQADLLGVSVSQDSYDWKIESTGSDNSTIWCGFYIFSDQTLLIRCLALKRHNFLEAVEIYRTEKPLTIHCFKQWFDLGHVNTYFRSRAAITTQRAFNELRIENGVLHKTGLPTHKIEAEANWFKQLPPKLKPFTPQLIDTYTDQEGKPFYALEYLPNMPLNELFVHGKNSALEWKSLFNLVKGFLKQANVDLPKEQHTKIALDFKCLIEDKTFIRLAEYAKAENLNLDEPVYYKNTKLPTLNEICRICIDKVQALPKCHSILHGDLCLSNTLYDSRALQIKVIDPRGMNSQGELSIYGDQKYDLAKLTHSIIGLYDHIIAGRYVLLKNEIKFDIDERILEIQKQYAKFDLIDGISIAKIMPLVVLLFLSMLPLHSDRPDRQKAMLMNALRLYSESL
ncbi:hypothetical protein [Acinetobacter sp. HY1485]|uniref:hypothetical protein n=1 Tax=Acinetobacter sp. HY1485 TaxID=2970918 RepID=UPI0022B95296|nr:hypothetical protein [Acinetobacter sp. HY1485]